MHFTLVTCAGVDSKLGIGVSKVVSTTFESNFVGDAGKKVEISDAVSSADVTCIHLYFDIVSELKSRRQAKVGSNVRLIEDY